MIILAIIVIAVGIFAWKLYPLVAQFAAYKAKIVASGIFVSHQSEEMLLQEDAGKPGSYLDFLNHFSVKVDEEAGTVKASFYGLVDRTAVYREGMGTSVTHGAPVDQLRSQSAPIQPPPPLPDDVLWPEGEMVDTSALPAEIDAEAFRALIDAAFVEEMMDDPENPGETKVKDPKNTRAVVVVYDGRIIADAYADGFDAETPLGGWSMTKSITNAMLGICVRDGILTLDDDHLLEEWAGEEDGRAAIKVRNLMQMSSGLDFDENYFNPRGGAAFMLFRTGNAGEFAAQQPLAHEPGTVCKYSSGDTNILCLTVRRKINDDPAYWALPYQEVFYPIGAHSAVFEQDASGTFIGSSFAYLTARDWARLGQLYANDGVWNGQRILPEGWMEFSRSSPPADETGKYGAHFLKRIIQGNADLANPILPPEAFHMSGFQDQYVTIIPERKLVVVRLGLTLQEGKGAWDQEKFVYDILQTIKAP